MAHQAKLRGSLVGPCELLARGDLRVRCGYCAWVRWWGENSEAPRVRAQSPLSTVQAPSARRQRFLLGERARSGHALIHLSAAVPQGQDSGATAPTKPCLRGQLHAASRRLHQQRPNCVCSYTPERYPSAPSTACGISPTRTVDSAAVGSSCASLTRIAGGSGGTR